MNASIDRENSSRIVLQKLSCPPGTYKQYKSYCFKECVKQQSIDYLPQEFIVIEPGSIKEPIKVKCDAQKGFYSTNGTWFYYDLHLLRNYQLRNYCEKIIDNPCPVGQRPLDNGSCVCGVGSWSKDENRCVQNIELRNDVKQQSTVTTTQTSSFHGDRDEPVHITQWILIALVAAAIFAACGIALYCFRKRKHYCAQNNIVNNNNKFKTATFIDKNTTYNMIQQSEDTGSNVTDVDDVGGD